MMGREDAKENDLFFTCSLIDYIARKTNNRRSTIVNALGKKNLLKIYDLADIYHSDNIERVSDDFIATAGIAKEKGIDVIDALLLAYNSFVSEKIEDFNSSFYYDAPQNILNAFLDGKIE